MSTARRDLRVCHPVDPDIDEIALVMPHEPAPGEGVSARNTVVLPNGRLTGTTTVGPYRAVLPTISGRGWITGHQYVLDPTDPFAEGYTLGDIWGQ